jgi:hypothetical protein
VEARAQHRRVQGRQFGLQRRADGRGEAFGCLHDDVDHERPADEPDLGALPVQVGDGLVDLPRGALAHASPAVQDPVDGGLAQSRLTCDLTDREGVAHAPAP